MHTQWKLNDRDVYEARIDHGHDGSGDLYATFWMAPVTRNDGSVWYSVSFRFSDQETVNTVDFKPNTFLGAAAHVMDHAPHWLSTHFFRR